MKPKIIVIGGGLAGLMTTLKAVERGAQVELFSLVPVRRSHSVCAQGGINAAVNTKGEGDSPFQHYYDTIYGGDFLAHQLPVKKMCEEAPHIIYLLARMGVPFNRTSEGFLDFRRFGGTQHHRTAFAGATTGQQLLYALDEQVRRFEDEGTVQKFEHWEFLSLVLDEGKTVKGIVALNMQDMSLYCFQADAVVLATGGPGYIFGKSTNSVSNTGAAASRVYQQGAIYANGEFIQVHPTAIPGEDKLRLISESVRGEGGRVWVPKDGKPWYFLEEWYPAYGNLVPRDVASRAIYKVCHELNLGVDGKEAVYLDVRHLDRKLLDQKLKGVLEIYEKFMGKDPRQEPMLVYPAIHYSMGGLWVDDQHRTNLAGLFAVGECDYQYHGANRLGANSLLSCLYSGLVCGVSVADYAKHTSSHSQPALFEAEKKRQQAILDRLLHSEGGENPFLLHKEFSKLMADNCLIVSYDQKLKETGQKLLELLERYQKITLDDKTTWANQTLIFARALYDMQVLARVVVLGQLHRKESRGSLYKPEYPKRDDQNWLKVTKARYAPGGPVLEYEPVEIADFKPVERKYA